MGPLALAGGPISITFDCFSIGSITLGYIAAGILFGLHLAERCPTRFSPKIGLNVRLHRNQGRFWPIVKLTHTVVSPSLKEVLALSSYPVLTAPSC